MNIKALIFGIAVFVLTLFVATYGVDMIYDEPMYDDFCSNSFLKVNEMNESVCFENGGKWNPSLGVNGSGWCDRNYSCNKAYELSRERYSMNIFLISIPLGIIILLGGLYFFRIEAVSIGIMAGGVGTILRGVSSYWSYSQDWLRFLISLVGLFVVIWFGSRFFNAKKK